MYYSREKRYLEDHGAYIIEKIIGCFEERYGNLFGGEETFEVNVNSDEGDRVLFDVTCLLNCNVWCKPGEDVEEEDVYKNQLTSLLKLFIRAIHRGSSGGKFPVNSSIWFEILQHAKCRRP